MTDVVVAGAGPAGLAAAVTAARAGLHVTMADPLPRVGGNAAISTGYLAILGSDQAVAAGVDDSAERYVGDLLRELEQYHGVPQLYFDRELAITFARRTTQVYRLLSELGFTFAGFVNRPAQYSVPRLLKVSDAAMFDTLFRRECDRLGIELLLGQRVTGLDGSSPPSVQIEGPDGQRVVQPRRGVVLATGGYQAPGPLRDRHAAGLPPSAPHLGVPTCSGDGHVIAAERCIELVNMDFVPRIVMMASALAEDVIAVRADGRRFHDETGPSEDRVRAVSAAGDGTFYIFDDAARARYPELVRQLPATLHTAPTLKGLAAHIGCDARGLRATASAWNARVTSGDLPDEFGRVIAPPSGAGIRRPPYHASACTVGCAFTVGGIRVDARGRALTASGMAAPGLYAAGDVCGSLNAAAGTGGVHITSALALGMAVGESLSG